MNDQDNETVMDLIDRTAKSTGATAEFSNSVVELFRSKGISLVSEGQPYAKAVSHAFACHVVRHQVYLKLQQDLKRLNGTLVQLQQTCNRLVEETDGLEAKLKRRSAAAPPEVRKESRAEPMMFGFGLRRDFLPN